MRALAASRAQASEVKQFETGARCRTVPATREARPRVCLTVEAIDGATFWRAENTGILGPCVPRSQGTLRGRDPARPCHMKVYEFYDA